MAAAYTAAPDDPTIPKNCRLHITKILLPSAVPLKERLTVSQSVS